MSPVIGTEIEVVDEVTPVVAPTATDPAFLIHSAATAVERFTSRAAWAAEFDGDAAMLAIGDAYFAEGGATITAVPLLVDTEDDIDIVATLAQIPADLGPGQVLAPEVNTGALAQAIADWAWTTNRVYIADATEDAIDDLVAGLGEAVAQGPSEGRVATVVADTLQIPGPASGTTRDVPGSVVLAALIARSDRLTGNPGLAAAGVNGQCRYVVGISDERNQTRRDTLAANGVITFRTLYGSLIRAYGYRTAAVEANPLWWDLSGARVVMAFRARAQAIAEDQMFAQIDREGRLLATFGSRLSAELADLQRAGALYGTTTDPGYTVASGWDVNPPEQVAQGHIRAVCRLRTSPFAERVTVSIIRRPTDQEV